MAKKSRTSTADQVNDSAKPAEATLSTLHHDGDLGYKIRVLLHDLSNIGSDLNAHKRLSSTTHELYISGPYFTECEAIKIRTTLVNNTTNAIITKEQAARSVNEPSSSFIKGLHWRKLFMADWPTSSKSVELAVIQGRADRTTWSRSMQAFLALKPRS